MDRALSAGDYAIVLGAIYENIIFYEATAASVRPIMGHDGPPVG